VLQKVPHDLLYKAKIPCDDDDDYVKMKSSVKQSMKLPQITAISTV